MAHAEHFLSRLERLEQPHVELSLALYRDPELVRFILQGVAFDGGSDRVALSLEDPERGPFVIVDRSGAFITCLAEGMVPSEVAIVSRDRLEGSAVRLRTLRERVEAARARAGGKGGPRKLFR